MFTSTFTSAHLHLCSSSHPHIYMSARLHILTSTSHIFTSHLHLTSSPSLFLTFSLKAGGSAAGPPRNATLWGDRARRMSEMQARVRFGFVRRNPLPRSCALRARNADESALIGPVRRNPLRRLRASNARNAGKSAFWKFGAGNPLRRSRASRARNAGESAFWSGPAQPSAEILRVECAKCRRECVLDFARATFCGDRARRGREMQARVRFAPVRSNPLRRSCASNARNAGKSAICPGRGQPSAEIARVEGAKCRRECDLSRSGATLCGDRARRRCIVRGAICGAGS